MSVMQCKILSFLCTLSPPAQVHLEDGSAVSFVSRERPKLVMGDDGRPAYLSNAVQPPQAGAGADAGVTHTLIVPLNVKQNRQ